MSRPLILALLLALPLTAPAQEATRYHLVNKVPIAADGGWDYLNLDQQTGRLYVTHGAEVDVLDTHTDTLVGTITGLVRSHGVAISPFGRGFITSGGNSTVRVFDLKTLATIADLPAAGSPDGILYEAKTKQVFAFDHAHGIVTVIDAQTAKVAGTIDIGGQPEFPATDNNGTVWVNQEDKSILVKIDAASMKVLNTWSDAPCEGPTGMDLDRVNRRLFIGCGNEKMAVVNADTGQVVTTLPIGIHVDATWFDPAAKLIFNANRSNVTIIRQLTPDTYTVVQTLATEGHSNTLALDFKTHKLYTANSLYRSEPLPPDAPGGAKPKETVIPGSSAIFVYAP